MTSKNYKKAKKYIAQEKGLEAILRENYDK